MRLLLTVVLTAIVFFIAGYLAGGWIYEAAGDGVWEAVGNWQTLIAGLVAGGAALSAARRAWFAVERQIAADDERREREQHERLAAQAHALSFLLTAAAVQLKARPVRPIDAHIVDLCTGRIEEAMLMDVRLGAALAAWVHQANINNGRAEDFRDEPDREDGEFADLLAGRTELLSAAFLSGGVSLKMAGKISTAPLVDGDDLAQAGFMRDPNDYPLGWVGGVAQVRVDG